jgi:hypothetical protein
MMRKALVLTVMLVVAVTFFASCNRQPDVDKDKAAVRALVEADTTHFNSGTAGDSSENSLAADDTTMGIWWRGPQTHDSLPAIEVEVVGESARVAWHQHNYGEIYHWVKIATDTAVKWAKPLQEAVQINGVYTRDGKEADADRGWKLKKISLAYGESESTNTVRIDSLRIHSSIRDILITGPLTTYYWVDSLVTFTPGEQLTLTLYTSATEGCAWLHAFWGILFVRSPFEDQGNGVYTGTWNAQIIPGFRFAIFDLMTKRTLMNEPAPYDYNGWLLPYQIHTAK